MKLYIKSTACISPLEIETTSNIFELKKSSISSAKRFLAIEPNYKDYLNFNIIRRVSKFTKMGLFSALKCLDALEVTLNAILVGTGIGGFKNTEVFLTNMIDDKESNLSPNAFFQSLHSSLSGNIAILLKSNAYNITYVNRGTSFESTLYDAQMHITENMSHHILVGASDEASEDYAKIVHKVNYLQQPKEQADIVVGEGASFMVLSGKGTKDNVAICGVETLFRASISDTANSIKAMLYKNNMISTNIDIIVSGHNNLKEIIAYEEANFDFKNTPIISYKKFIGEYPSSTAFAVWLSEKIIVSQHIPKLFNSKSPHKNKLINILVVNQYKSNTSLILISK